jgi:peptide/nickel transport system permease protein/oligopeptide transport system permease protein
MRFLLRRLALAGLVVWGVLTAVFVLMRVVPGDPAALLLGTDATAEMVAAARAQMGLDRPILEQYARFLRGVVTLDLGRSLYLRTDVAALLLERLPASAELAGGAVLVACLIAFPLGIAAGLRHGSWVDHLANGVTLLGQALPSFWVGLMLVFLFSRALGWLPPFGRGGVEHLIMPAVTLGLAFSGLLTRVIRAGVIETKSLDYIRTARAKGLPERSVVGRHLLKNTMIQVVTVLGLQLGQLLAGAIVVETVFAWPGWGQLLADGVAYRDYTLVQGVTIALAAAFALLNLAVDGLYALLDPRIRLS